MTQENRDKEERGKNSKRRNRKSKGKKATASPQLDDIIVRNCMSVVELRSCMTTSIYTM
jgi:hypothetical protein